jgi:PIN domain nuclease of toxin-antitoxin system
VKLLLDTHALIWWMEDSPRLPGPARAVIADTGNTVLVSAASAWEITTKHRLGRLPMSDVVVRDLAAQVQAEGFAMMDISFRHACLAGSMAQDHRDPFDRMLIAQALAEGMALVSNEAAFDGFGVTRVW